MDLIITWLLYPIETACFTWRLWRKVKYDGTGHRITIWYAITWAADRKFWEEEG